MDTYRNIYRHMYIDGLVYTHTFPCSVSWESLEAINPSSNQHTKHSRSYFLIPLSNKRNQGSLEKWLIQGLTQRLCTMSLKHLVVPESKFFKRKKKCSDGSMSKKQEPIETASHSKSKNTLSKK